MAQEPIDSIKQQVRDTEDKLKDTYTLGPQRRKLNAYLKRLQDKVGDLDEKFENWAKTSVAPAAKEPPAKPAPAARKEETPAKPTPAVRKASAPQGTKPQTKAPAKKTAAKKLAVKK
jgi:hypothetical protein